MRGRIHESYETLAAFFTSRMVAFSITLALAFAVIGQFMTMQNLFVIMIGGELILHKTYESDIHNVLLEAGVSVLDADIDSLTYSPSGGISELVIRRNSYVTIEADGKTYRRSTMGDSVSGMLSRVGVSLGVNDHVTPDLGMPTSDGMHIVVTRHSQQMRSEFVEIPYETIRKPQKNLNAGQEKIVQVGVAGEIERLYQMSFLNGQYTGESFIRERTISEPVTEIIEYGTGGTVNVGGTNMKFVRAIDVTATAYTTEGSSSKHTATGTVARVGAIAVDPKVIPLGSKVYVEAPNGKWVYGVATCEDTGRLIKGNIIDLYFDTRAECWSFGRRKAVVYILE